MKHTTVVIPFAFTPRWGQIVISSLKAFKNDRDFKIVIMNNSPERNDIDAVAKTTLGEGVEIRTTTEGQRIHAGSLDDYLPHLETPYMFALESDCTVNRDGWLDWFASYMKDEYMALAGWYWVEGPDIDDLRHYVNATATLYNSRILKMLYQECMNNQDHEVCYGLKMEKRFYHPETDARVRKGHVGPFSEYRGFFHMYPVVPLPDKWWHEPGNWLYNRASCQWEVAHVPGQIVRTMQAHAPDYKYNYYGESDEEAYARHYWAGTVSHNFDKHLVSVFWEADSIEWWLRREHALWNEVVPEPVKRISIQKGYVKKLEDELKYALSRVHILKDGDLVRVYHTNVQKYIEGQEVEPNLPGDGLNARIVTWHHTHAKWVIEFDEKPTGEPYPEQYEDCGKWYAETDSLNCVKR